MVHRRASVSPGRLANSSAKLVPPSYPGRLSADTFWSTFASTGGETARASVMAAPSLMADPPMDPISAFIRLFIGDGGPGQNGGLLIGNGGDGLPGQNGGNGGFLIGDGDTGSPGSAGGDGSVN
jgi:hypothetical protein